MQVPLHWELQLAVGKLCVTQLTAHMSMVLLCPLLPGSSSCVLRNLQASGWTSVALKSF